MLFHDIMLSNFSLLTYITNNTTAVNNFTTPAGVIANDLCVLINIAQNSTFGSIPAAAVPSGFTQISTATGGASNNVRIVLSCKILASEDIGSTLTGMTGNSLNQMYVVYFRMSKPIASFSQTGTSQITTATPTNQTISTSAATKFPVLAYAYYSTSGTLGSTGFSPTEDQTVTWTNSAVKFKIYHGVTVSDHTISMADFGTNYMASARIELTV